MIITPFPLCWPNGVARAKSRTGGSFQRTESAAKGVIEDELRRMDATTYIISSSRPLGSRAEPSDPGVACWFMYKGSWRSIAVDHYATYKANLCAIAATLEALRTILRHGGIGIFEQAMSGFMLNALPAPRDWREILGPCANLDQLTAAHRRLRADAHPDKHGGDRTKWDEIEAAFDRAKTELTR